MDVTSSQKWKELVAKVGDIKDRESYKKALALFYEEFGENMHNLAYEFVTTFRLSAKINIGSIQVKNDLENIKRELREEIRLKKQIGSINDMESYHKALQLYYEEFGFRMFDTKKIQEFIETYQLNTWLHITNKDIYRDLNKIKLTGVIKIITDISSYKNALELYSTKNEDKMFNENLIESFIKIYELDTKLHIGFNDVQTDLKKIKYTKEFGTITDKESYKKVLELYYNKKYGSKIFDKDKIQEFIDMYELDTLLHINVNDVQTDLRKIKYTREFGTITDKESYKKILEKCYEKYGSEVLDEEWIQEFIDIYELDILLHINVNDVQTDLKKIKYTGRIDAITDIESYRDALELCYGKFKEELFDKEKIQEFIDIYELDTVLHIGFNNVQTDLKKIKYTGEIITITDKESYRKALELYYKEYTGKIFDKDKIQEFIDMYELDILLHISFSEVCIDLVRLHFENKRIKVIIDNHSYLEALELLYLKFDEIIIFDEEFICKFINAYHLDTRFNISLNDVWNDLAKIKRQSELDSAKIERELELEDKILDEIDTVEDIESYKEALELYYNVFGKDMFEIDKVQEFIDYFDLHDIGITSNTVYRDLRAIERAFGSREEISQSNFASLYPDIKPAETITPPVKEQRTQVQTTNTIQPEQTQNRQVRTEDTTPPRSVLDAQKLFNYIKTMPVKWEYANPNVSPNKELQQLCNGFLTGGDTPKSFSPDVLKAVEYNIQKKRARTPNKPDYNKVMETNMLFELYKYAYCMNAIKVLVDRKNDTVKINISELMELIQEDCHKRLSNLEYEKRNNPAIHDMLQKYQYDTQRVKMVINDYVEGREYDYIYAYLMTTTLMNILNYVLNSETDTANGYQPTLKIARQYPSSDLTAALDAYISSFIGLALNSYTSGGSIPRRHQ